MQPIKRSIQVICRVLLCSLIVFCPVLRAQHIYWTTPVNNATDVYGQVVVLADYGNTYYCGFNFNYGSPAGGYAGIQDIVGTGPDTGHQTIFSIWDTNTQANQFSTLVYAAPGVDTSRFTDEGSGEHSNMTYSWQIGQIFQYYIHKRPAKNNKVFTDYYVYMGSGYGTDVDGWKYVATIASVLGNAKPPSTVTTMQYGMSFLESFTGLSPNSPRIALYKVWMGQLGASGMTQATTAENDAVYNYKTPCSPSCGLWGTVGSFFFLATGNGTDPYFKAATKQFGPVQYGGYQSAITVKPDAPDSKLPGAFINTFKELNAKAAKLAP